MSAVAADPERETRLYAKVTGRLVPLLFLGYIAAQLDRINVGFAKLQMAVDLHFSDAVYGFGAGVFFISYCLAQPLANLVLQRIGARIWLGAGMIAWGVVSAATASVKTPGMFYVLRLLLGLVEAGFFPGAIFFLTTWYPARRRASIIASFMAAIGLTGVCGSPLSGWIMRDMAGRGGWSGWQWLFLLEAIPAIVGGSLILSFLTDSIRVAPWLSPEEKALLDERLEADRRPEAARPIGRTLAGWRIWLFALINFTLTIGTYSIALWLPQMIADAGVTEIFQVGWLGAIPYLVAVAAMVAIGHHSDRKGERRWHMTFAVFSAVLGLVLVALFGREKTVVVLGLSLATAGVLAANPLLWASFTSVLGGTSAAVGIGFISSIGGLAGFVGPYMMGVIRDVTHGTAQSECAIAGSLFLCGLLILFGPPIAAESGAAP